MNVTWLQALSYLEVTVIWTPKAQRAQVERWLPFTHNCLQLAKHLFPFFNKENFFFFFARVYNTARVYFH